MNIEAARLERSTVTVANAIELTAQVIRSIAGNEISNTLNGETITLAQVSQLAAARFQKKLESGSK